MSVENLKEYARRCATDPQLRERAKTIGAANVDEQIAHSKSIGLDWTRDDLHEFKKELEAEGELSEEDLEQVAGGVVTTTAAAVVGAAAGVAGAAAGVVGAGAAVAATTGGGGW